MPRGDGELRGGTKSNEIEKSVKSLLVSKHAWAGRRGRRVGVLKKVEKTGMVPPSMNCAVNVAPVGAHATGLPDGLAKE